MVEMAAARRARIVLATTAAVTLALLPLTSCSGTDTGPGSGSATPEICDGFDNNFNGLVDEGCSCDPGAQQQCYSGNPVSVGIGVCRAGAQSCQGETWGPCVGEVRPADEQCNGIDDNCDGLVDEGCPCPEGEQQQCYGGPPSTIGIGVCRAGTQTCQGSTWGSCHGAVGPSAEQCNGLDDDCDGLADEDCYCGDGVMSGTEQCDGSDFGDATCLALGFPSGMLTCTAGCTIDTASCTPQPTWHWPYPGGTDIYPPSSLGCSGGNAEQSDGLVVGLDYPSNGSPSYFDGVPVTSCVRAYFDQRYVVTQLRIRAAWVNQACSVSCSSGYCNGGAEAQLFYFDRVANVYRHLSANDGQPLTSTLADWTWPVAFTSDVVLVCRGGGGYARDDVVVDSVSVFGN